MKINACVRVMQDGDSGVGGIVMIDHREGCAGGNNQLYARSGRKDDEQKRRDGKEARIGG